jgi:hypothetical protein
MDMYRIKLTELSTRAISLRPEASFLPPERKVEAPKAPNKREMKQKMKFICFFAEFRPILAL